MPSGEDQQHFKKLHSRLIELMNTPTLKRNSYNLSYRGICLGLTSMAIQAILINTTEYIKFCNRIKLLYKFFFNTKPKYFLTKEEQIDLDIFLEGIALYQEPYKYKVLISQEQRIVNYKIRDYHSLIFQIIKPLAFNICKKNIHKFPNFLGCYGLQDIKTFLDVLKETINKVLIDEHIAFMLHIHNHIIALRYDHDHTSWTLIDSNMLNIVDQLHICESMAKLLVEAFVNYDKNSADIKLAIATDPIITVNETDDLSIPIGIQNRFLLELERNESWQQIHQITKDKLDRTNDGASWLYISARSGQLDIVKQLIEARADVNLSKDSGLTPLWVAVQDGYTEVAETLLESGAYVDPVNLFTGTTPLLIASQNDYNPIVKLLIKFNADVKKSNHNGITPLLVASQNGNIEIANDLINANANINSSNTHGITPLWMAVKNKHFPLIEYLLKQGAELTDPNNSILPPSTTKEYDNIGNNRLVVFDSYDELDSFYNIKKNDNDFVCLDDNRKISTKTTYKITNV